MRNSPSSMSAQAIESVIVREQTTHAAPDFNKPPTREELITIALVIEAKYNLAVRKGIERRVQELGDQLQRLTRFADEVTL
jgi:hypothetical protein